MSEDSKPDEELQDPDLINLLGDLDEEKEDTGIVAIEPEEEPREESPEAISSLELARSIIEKFGDISQSIIKNFDEDRKELDEVIEYFKNEMDNLGTQAPRVYPETLASLMKTKSDATANVVRILDSTIKLVGVGKIVSQSESDNGFDEDELMKLLESSNDD